MRTLDELIVKDSTTWAQLAALLIRRTINQVLEANSGQSFDTLLRLQVTSDSMMGAVVLHAGGILADHGWFRILGCGSGSDLPSIADANALDPSADTTPGHLVVGYDVLGGQFAVDQGGLGIGAGAVCYFGPDSLAWDGLGGGYPAFVQAAVGGQLGEVFASLRWPGWENDLANLPLGMSIASYPPPFSEEGRDLSQTAKNPVPTSELVDFYATTATRRHQAQADQD